MGSKAGDLKKIIEKTRKILVMNHGFKAEETSAAVGLTLDVNHALTKAPEDQKAERLAEWFEALAPDMKCFHVYVPSAGKEGEKSVNNQLELLRQLCDQYHIRPEVFLESKKDLATTKQIYAAGKKSVLAF